MSQLWCTPKSLGACETSRSPGPTARDSDPDGLPRTQGLLHFESSPHVANGQPGWRIPLSTGMKQGLVYGKGCLALSKG